MSLVSWKKKRDKCGDESDGDDDDEVKEVKFANRLKPVEFIKSDSVNAKAMKSMGMKQWW